MLANKVNDFLKNCNYTFPIDVFDIAEQKGFSIRYLQKADSAFDGAIDHAEKAIYINCNKPLVRQRFTCAHELGHACLHPNESQTDYRIDQVTNKKEKEANAFAAELLMPIKEFKHVCERLKQESGKIDFSFLAGYFEVSQQATLVRYDNLYNKILKHAE